MKQNKQKRRGVIFWLPRILSIIFILFLTMFSLDIFGNGYSFWEIVVGLLVHNIPSLILLIVLTLILSLYRLEFGLLIIAGELFIGSFGYLFAWPFTYHISLRIALWGVVLLVFAFNFIQQLIKSGRDFVLSSD